MKYIVMRITVDTQVTAGQPIFARPRADLDHYVVGYGGAVEIPTIDVIFGELNVVGNLVGTYNDLVELMALSARAGCACRPRRTRSTRCTTPSPTSTAAASRAAASSSRADVPG
jgi:D-arabinose 1-dehydrogenase-like Zn-dependent alcohol dehydrogenase